MNKFRMLDLFSGIGGFSLAAQWVWGDELKIVAFVEIDPFCQKVLRKHWPWLNSNGIPIITDIRRIRGDEKWRPIDIVCGGFPCTQTSTISALHSQRKGLNGKDSCLWFEYLRIVQAFRPIWVIVENTPGVLTWADTIETGLEGAGYRVSRFQLTAWGVGAPHLRRRVFFVANSMRERCEEVKRIGESSSNAPLHSWPPTPGGTWSMSRAGVYRMDDGIPNRVDRLKSLGNAVIPQVAAQIFRAIKEVETVGNLTPKVAAEE